MATDKLQHLNFVNTQRAAVLKALGVTVDRVGSEITAYWPSAHSMYQSYVDTKHESVREGMTGNNKEYSEKSFSDRGGESGFTGSTVKQICDAAEGKFDQAPFLEARDRISKEIGALETVESMIARKRKRNLNEHDGEMDFDRLYDINYFNNTRIENSGSARTVDINVSFGINCGVTPAQINEYGCTVWAVIDLLERSGIQCNVTLFWQTNGELGTSGINQFRLESILKRAGEYVDPMDLARCFTSGFYRRVNFNAQCLISDAIGTDAQNSLGCLEQKRSSADRGVINFDPELLQGWNGIDMSKVASFVKTAVNGKQE
jgi:hypothetical protein